MSTNQNSCQQIPYELAHFYQESRERTLSLSKMADGSDRKVTQAVQNVNSQWSLFFIDLDELLSEYEHYRSMNDIAITENFGKFISSFAKCISLCITD